MGNLDKIGGSIRSLRKSKKKTLQQLAQETGLSTGYLSNIERDFTSPTLANLQKICEIFNTSLGDLLERNAEEKIIIRKKDREGYVDDDTNMKIEIIDFGLQTVSFLSVELAPLSETRNEWWTHTYGEVGTVQQGKLNVILEGDEFFLEEGDSIYIKANTKHSFYNDSADEACLSFWVRITTDEDILD